MSAHPHTDASGIVQRYEHPVYGALKAVAQPLKFDGERNPVRRPAPLLGQHTREILLEAGYAPAEIDRFISANVIFNQE
jgi:crotonobetainyl-CoA:carnitine CoA-transferase CaiB-like acyl-CoA transferase